MTEFQAFPKIPRWSREIVITEKIDGTNASIYISDDLTEFKVGSRTRWITPENDNYGFAKWAYANKEELLQLGPGHHFGEWWGKGIQRGYGIDSKQFTLFNAGRWTKDTVPAIVSVVPVLYIGKEQSNIETSIEYLRKEGSCVALGFMQPEGIVVYHTASRTMYKKTLEKDESPKGNVNEG